MKATFGIMYTPLAVAEVPTLYHFYSMIFLGCHCSAEGRIQPTRLGQAEGLRRFTFSLTSDFHLCHFAPLFFTPSFLSHLVISRFLSLIHPCNPFIHAFCSLSEFEQREHGKHGKHMQTVFSVVLSGSNTICNLEANFEVQTIIPG